MYPNLFYLIGIPLTPLFTQEVISGSSEGHCGLLVTCTPKADSPSYTWPPIKNIYGTSCIASEQVPLDSSSTEQASLSSYGHLNGKETPSQYKSELHETPGHCPTPGSLQAFPDHPQFPLLQAPPLNHEFPHWFLHFFSPPLQQVLKLQIRKPNEVFFGFVVPKSTPRDSILVL